MPLSLFGRSSPRRKSRKQHEDEPNTAKSDEPLRKSWSRSLSRTSSRLTMKHLKKYLLKKIKTEMSVEVEILCRGTLLDDEHSLGVIWRAPGRDQADDLVLEFRLLPLEGSFEAAAAAELTALERRGTPLGRAKFLCMTGRAAAGSAAHIVLEWGAPWSRQTHRFYPPAVRARVVEVLLRPCALFFSGKDDRKAPRWSTPSRRRW